MHVYMGYYTDRSIDFGRSICFVLFTVERLKAVINLANVIATNQSTCRAASPDFSSLHTVRDKMSAVAFDP